MGYNWKISRCSIGKCGILLRSIANMTLFSDSLLLHTFRYFFIVGSDSFVHSFSWGQTKPNTQITLSERVIWTRGLWNDVVVILSLRVIWSDVDHHWHRLHRVPISISYFEHRYDKLEYCCINGRKSRVKGGNKIHHTIFNEPKRGFFRVGRKP